MRSMVEGHLRVLLTSMAGEPGQCPSTSYAGPPPLKGRNS